MRLGCQVERNLVTQKTKSQHITVANVVLCAGCMNEQFFHDVFVLQQFCDFYMPVLCLQLFLTPTHQKIIKLHLTYISNHTLAILTFWL